MHIKFLNQGTGSGTEVIKRLMADTDSKGNLRVDTQVYRGDPRMVGWLIESLQFVHRYRYAIIAYHPDDAPTDAEIEYTLDEFEKVAFAGLNWEQYDWCAVMHQNADGLQHIHIIIACVDLTTGRKINVAPPGWPHIFYAFRDVLNYEHGWARPDDPRLSRLISPPSIKYSPSQIAEHHSISSWLNNEFATRRLNTHADVIAALETQGVITSISKFGISIKVSDKTNPIRFKGALFDANFSGDVMRNKQTRPQGREQPDPLKVEAARATLAELVSKRSAYNAQHYPHRVEPIENAGNIFEQYGCSPSKTVRPTIGEILSTMRHLVVEKPQTMLERLLLRSFKALELEHAAMQQKQ